MPIDLDSIESDIATCPVVYGGMDAKVQYRPSVLTPKAMAQFDNAKSYDEIADFICGVDTTPGLIVDWDIKRTKKKVPVTAAGMSDIPLGLLRAVIEACMDDQGQTSGNRPRS